MEDAEEGDIFPFDWRVLDPVGFELLGELLIQYDVGLGVGGVSLVWKAR